VKLSGVCLEKCQFIAWSSAATFSNLFVSYRVSLNYFVTVRSDFYVNNSLRVCGMGQWRIKWDWGSSHQREGGNRLLLSGAQMGSGTCNPHKCTRN